MEQQVKKAEAAQRRKVQVEKAARESEVGVLLSLSLSIVIYRFKMYCEIHVRDDGLDLVSTG